MTGMQGLPYGPTTTALERVRQAYANDLIDVIEMEARIGYLISNGLENHQGVVAYESPTSFSQPHLHLMELV